MIDNNKSLQNSKKNTINSLTIVKFGGGVIKRDGEGIPRIIQRIKTIKKKDKKGPIVIVSAPKGITDLAIQIGMRYVKDGNCKELIKIEESYIKIRDNFMINPFNIMFNQEFQYCFKKVKKALKQVSINKEFEGALRAIVLAYSGEILTSKAIDYILRSNKINSINIPFSKWPIITDKSYDGANFLFDESKKNIRYIIEKLENNKVPILGGFIGRSFDGRETTFDRGGSDRTAIDLGLLLTTNYNLKVDFEKDNMIMSANPNIEGMEKDEIDPVWHLSYNEALLGAQYGMDIIDSMALIDIQRININIPLEITNIENIKKFTKINKEKKIESENPIKIVTGKKGCIILKIRECNKLSLRDYLEKIKRFENFTELRPFKKDGQHISKILFLDNDFFKKYEEEIRGFDEFTEIEGNLGAITLIGDEMYRVPDISAEIQSAIKGHNINIDNADAQKETSSILIIINEDYLEKSINLIHKKRRELNKRFNKNLT